MVHEIYQQHKIAGFYRGLSLSLVLSLHVVSQISIYEKLMTIKTFLIEFIAFVFK